MAIFEPGFSLELVYSLKHCLGTYAVCTVRVRKVACKVNLMWLNLLQKFNDDIDVCLCPFPLLDSSGLVERKVKEVAVGLVIETERADGTFRFCTSDSSL